MEIYRDNTITLRFTDDGTPNNEVKVLKSLFTKFNTISQKAGYRKDFSLDETEMIQGIHQSISKVQEVL